jgi:hypothetical protein
MTANPIHITEVDNLAAISDELQGLTSTFQLLVDLMRKERPHFHDEEKAIAFLSDAAAKISDRLSAFVDGLDRPVPASIAA